MKIITGILCGTGGIGVTSPIVYATASQSSFETLWRQVVDDKGPIISCNENSGNGNQYKIEIIKATKPEESMGSYLSLKVSMKKARESHWQEIWRRGSGASGKDVWSEWTVKLERSGIERIQYKEVSRTGDLMVKGCKFENGELDETRLSEGNKDIESKNMGIKLTNCKGWIFSKKCNIKLSSGDNLNWGIVTVPTVTYYAF